MYKHKKIIAFIPARKGSKRIKNKNTINLNGKPLFEYSVDIARKSKYIDDILVSTDSNEILKRAHELGCIKNDLRPQILANDYSRIIDSVMYELDLLKDKDYYALVLLQPTFPIRTIEMIDNAIEKFFESKESLITVVKQKESPLFMRQIENGRLEKLIEKSSDIRSQDMPQYYRIVGSIYINQISVLTSQTVFNENKVPFEIDPYFAVDIDYEEDLEVAKERIKNEDIYVSLCSEKR